MMTRAQLIRGTAQILAGAKSSPNHPTLEDVFTHGTRYLNEIAPASAGDVDAVTRILKRLIEEAEGHADPVQFVIDGLRRLAPPDES